MQQPETVAEPLAGEFDAIIQRIEAAPIVEKPFAHIYFDNLFLTDTYQLLLDSIPPVEHFRKVPILGSGYLGRRRGSPSYTLVCDSLQGIRLIEDIDKFFASQRFMRTLLEKFSKPLNDGTIPITPDKQRLFQDGKTQYGSILDLLLTLPGYSLPPHPDIWSKIVSYQVFLVDDDSLRDYGTQLCEMKTDAWTRLQRGFAAIAGPSILKAATRLKIKDSRSFQRFTQTSLALRLGAFPQFLPYDWFKDRAMLWALPNTFMAFAPSPSTYHYAKFDVPRDHPKQKRAMFRGTIRAAVQTDGISQSAYL